MTPTQRAIGWALSALLCLWVLRANVSPAFTPVRAELVDVRGFSRGLLNLVVLRRDQVFPPPPRWSVVVVASALLLLWAAPSPRPGRTAWLLAALGASLLFATAVSAFVTPYRIVLAPRSFALCTLLLWFPFVSVRYVARFATVAGCGAVAAAFFMSAMFQTLADYQGNYSGFLHLSREVAAHTPDLIEQPELRRSLLVSEEGYDGQFMYVMAFDPLMRRFADRPQQYRAFIDAPPYRYGRIGFPLLTRLVSWGRPERYPATMVWLVLVAHFALAFALASIASRHGWPPLTALLYLGLPAFMSSLLSALPEALAAAALVAGFACWERRRLVWAAVCFAAALLVRETAIVLVAALIVASVRRDTRRGAAVLASSMIPVALWRLFVAVRLFPDWGWRAIIATPGDLGVPFAGLIHLAGAGTYAFPLVLAGAFALAARIVWERPSPLAVAAVVYGMVAVSLGYDKIWSHLPSGERGTFELFLCLLLLLLENRERASRTRGGLVALFVVLLAYTFVAAPDASTSRAALLLIR